MTKPPRLSVVRLIALLAPSIYTMRRAKLFAIFLTSPSLVASFVQQGYHDRRRSTSSIHRDASTNCSRRRSSSRLHFFQDDRSETEIEEEVRLNILESRRYQIRSMLKSAESVRNLRLRNGWVPELDKDGKPIRSDGKLAVTLTAFCVAAGAIALRVGGRAALISVVGLDFAQDNPELKDQLEQILVASESMDPFTKLLLFTLAWTGVKLLCFDAGGVVLALASGILFGGVVEGAVISAAAATFGSSLGFGMAKLDTPVRKKALEVLEEYPSLRGIEKVVAQDGLKAILTLRLAPILPIPIGMYNYIYGVTNVPLLDFAGGIFLGSLKPYLLDSYLGYFGKEIIEGSSDAAGFQDVLLLLALGLSVLIGVFASQLASETWDSVLAEVEAEKQSKVDGLEGDKDDGVARELLGWKLPDWLVDFQTSYKAAESCVNEMVTAEYSAKVWNYTKAEGGPPAALDPALQPGSPELEEQGRGFDFGESFFVGLALSPCLFSSWTKYADPLLSECTDSRLQAQQMVVRSRDSQTEDAQPKVLLDQLVEMKRIAKDRIDRIEKRLQDMQ